MKQKPLNHKLLGGDVIEKFPQRKPEKHQIISKMVGRTMETKHPGGRPSDYTQELADKICSQLSQGKSLRGVCLQEDMPSLQTIFTWFRTHKEFLEQYARATEERTEAQHEMLLDLGDEAIDLAQSVDPKASGAVVQGVKLKADNLKWVMSKMKPKKYGDKVDVTSDGKAIQGNIIKFSDFKENE